jgi:glycine hydroxymethyltransferase
MINKYLQELEKEETWRLNNDIELIASENYPSQDILDLMGSHFSVKYSEGFSKEVSKQGRHYAGCHIIDKLENYAIEQACKLFNCNYANVQPWSGSQANQAVYAGLLKPGDKVLGMSLAAGGHLTHVSPASDTSKEYVAEYYGLDENGYLNYEEIREKLYSCKPRLLVVGASAYSRIIEFERIKSMVDDYNQSVYYDCGGSNNPETPIKSCYLMVDMAHIAGLVAAGLHPSPLPYADVVTSTTHKTLRGPRGGLILWNDQDLCNKLNAGVFPRTQGGSNQATIAAKAQCFIEAQTPAFKKYAKQILLNMQAMIKGIKAEDTNNLIDFVSGGSDNHLVLVDISKTDMYGKEAEDRLTSYSIICNKNMIKDDKKPSDCTGIRLGTAAVTTRGFTEEMCFELGKIITKILLKKDEAEEGTVSLEKVTIKTKLAKMLDKVGPFYNKEVNYSPTPSDIA